jgi:hypothetical protein
MQEGKSTRSDGCLHLLVARLRDVARFMLMLTNDG